MLFLNQKHFNTLKTSKIKASKQNHSLLNTESSKQAGFASTTLLLREVVRLAHGCVLRALLVDYYVSVQFQPTCPDDTYGAENAVIHRGSQAGSSVTCPSDEKLHTHSSDPSLLCTLRDSRRARSPTSGPPSHPRKSTRCETEVNTKGFSKGHLSQKSIIFSTLTGRKSSL
uniref:Uncharacterized protein n=1 Tax=Pipistrellus kuhlii TaxID=59472 RepID=A0A7J7VUR9_PIPKU|nr:hypothetical protein mPipKuh1_008284 [Pipistrellus kuhlii]